MIGIYGGTFDPPHTEHLNIVINAKKELGLDKIILVPTFNAPHKSSGVSFEDRVNMCKLTFGDLVEIDTIEKYTLNANNYAYVILKELEQKYNDIVYIIGGDSLCALDTWKNPTEILKGYKLAVVPRNKDRDRCLKLAKRYKTIYGSDIKLLKYTGKKVSSQVIRGCLYLNFKPDNVKEEVYEYIVKNNLYDDYSKLVLEVKSVLKTERFDHVCGVVIKALSLNEEIGLPFDKVFKAALLHDVAKGKLATDLGVPSDAVGTKVAHQFSGAYLAKTRFNIDDEDILNAINYHTTGRIGMSLLEKLIYTADMIEDGRDFEGVEQIREKADISLEEGFKECLKQTYLHLKSQNNDIYYLTKQAYNYYLEG